MRLDAISKAYLSVTTTSLVALGLLTAHWLLRHTSIETVAAKMPRSLLAGIWTVMIGGLILNQGNGNAFIYFQF